MTLELVHKDIKQTATIKGPSKEDDLFLELSNYVMNTLGIHGDVTYRLSKWDPSNTENDKVVLRSTEQTIDGKWTIENPAKRDLSKIPYKSCRIYPNDLLITKSSGSSLHIGKTTLS